MKRYNDFLIVGIDHGYGNIKTANTVTPTGITKLDAAPTFIKHTLYYDGSYYLIGEGHKEYLTDKWEDNDNYLFTLMGIARELKREGITSVDVHLAVGLPLTWVNRQREDFRKYMLQRESVDFKYEDRLYTVSIIGCSVFPQGYAAVVPYLRDMTGLNMLADIGNGTVNIMKIKNLVTAEIPIDVEAKGKQSEQALLYTRLLCLGNGSPKALYDKSKGFFAV